MSQVELILIIIINHSSAYNSNILVKRGLPWYLSHTVPLVRQQEMTSSSFSSSCRGCGCTYSWLDGGEMVGLSSGIE